MLTEYYVLHGDNCSIVWEIFDDKETCFRKYPGDWNELEKSVFEMNDPSVFKRQENHLGVALSQVLFTGKSDVTI